MGKEYIVIVVSEAFQTNKKVTRFYFNSIKKSKYNFICHLILNCLVYRAKKQKNKSIIFVFFFSVGFLTQKFAPIGISVLIGAIGAVSRITVHTHSPSTFRCQVQRMITRALIDLMVK